MIEIQGGISSGRTALVQRMVAEVSRRGELVGWVDLPRALDPRSLQRAGVDLEGLLWVRPERIRPALRATELLLRTGFRLVVADLEGATPRDLERLGPAVWSRLLRAAREAQAQAVLLGTRHASGSFTTLGLHTERSRSRFEQGLFEGFDVHTTLIQNRSGPTGTEFALRLSHR